MYKTIRHGENSLQYTILPQNDDFRIEGKLSSAGSGSSSSVNGAGTTRKSKAKRPKRRSFFAYLGLIFVCTVIIGAILIPFLVSAECLPSPTEWFLKTKAALIKSGTSDNSSNESNGRNPNGNGNGINVGKTVKIISKDGVEKIILKLNKTAAAESSKNHEILQAVNKTTFENKNTSNINKTTENAQNFLDGNTAATAETETIDDIQQIEMEHSASIDEKETETQPNKHFNLNNDLDRDIDQNANTNTNNKPNTQTKNFVAEVRFDDGQTQTGRGASVATANQLSAITPTIVVTTLRGQIQQQQTMNNDNEPPIKHLFVTAPIIRPTSSFSTSSFNSPRAPANPNQNIIINSNPNNNASPPAMPTIMTRIIQVPLLKSAAKKPIIPPVLAKTNSQYSSSSTAYKNNNNNVVDSNGNSDQPAASMAIVQNPIVDMVPAVPVNDEQPPKNSDWVHSHWPYIDPTTYFQWTGYKAEDSVLLPALLGFALIGMILVITVCLVARNKRTIVSSVRKRNRNDIEETGADDNATLLTTTNLSDED